MFAVDIAEFVEGIIGSAGEWSKLLSVGAVAALGVVLTLIYHALRFLARQRVEDEVTNLRSQLVNATESLRVMKDDLKLSTQSSQLKDVESATKGQTIAFHENTIRQLNAAGTEIRAKNDKMMAAGQKLYKEVRELREIKAKYDRLVVSHAESLETIRILEDNSLTSSEKVVELTGRLEVRQKQLDQAERRMQKARRLRGYLLKAKALQARPKFRPVEDRKRAIVSVLNLKGGVGKTTLTAHLGAALARKGYRVLLIDLDLQGSLTGLMLPPGLIDERFRAKKLMQDFLLNAAAPSAGPGAAVDASLTGYIVPVPLEMPGPGPSGRIGSLSIVPASDDLAYAELNLTLGWLLKHGERDARFLLRKALHLKGANKPFDIVLLDCPPLFNISCVNALAASDFLLAPTLLSGKSIERVPTLVKAISEDEFKLHVNTRLKVMGVVANRASREPLAARETKLWQRLSHAIQSVPTAPTVAMMESIVAQNVEISSNEQAFAHPTPFGRADVMFSRLVEEFERGLPDACRRT